MFPESGTPYPFIKVLQSDSESSSDLKPIQKVNQYLLLKPIGKGSVAKVYYATNTENNLEFAIKKFKLMELRSVESGISQLEREIKAMKQINLPNIIHLYEVLYNTVDDIAYLVIEYADCGSLESIIERAYRDQFNSDDQNCEKHDPQNINTKLPISFIRPIFIQILHALQSLHEKGIIHQDIKPSNILIKSEGLALLSDFGVGHSFQSADMVVGSPAYQAPEAYIDYDDVEYDDPSKEDVWSLGITLYETLFGYLPYTGENVYGIMANIKSTPLIIPDCSPEIKDLLTKMLSVNPQYRFNITQTLEHPFFANKSSAFDPMRFKVKTSKEPDPDAQIVEVKAELKTDNFSFLQNNSVMALPLRKK